jgi:hypothetical protein
MDALPVTVTQRWGIFVTLFLFLSSRAPRYEARTQHFESVQKATKAATIRKMFRFEYDEKGARTGICSSIGLLEKPRASAAIWGYSIRLISTSTHSDLDRAVGQCV